jgi:hypothetical protein
VIGPSNICAGGGGLGHYSFYVKSPWLWHIGDRGGPLAVIINNTYVLAGQCDQIGPKFAPFGKNM